MQKSQFVYWQSFIHSDGTQNVSVHFKNCANVFIDVCCFYIELMMFCILTQTFLDCFYVLYLCLDICSTICCKVDDLKTASINIWFWNSICKDISEIKPLTFIVWIRCAKNRCWLCIHRTEEDIKCWIYWSFHTHINTPFKHTVYRVSSGLFSGLQTELL